MTTSSTTPTPAQAAGTPEIHLEASPDIGTTDANHVEKQQQVEESPTTSTMDKQQEGTNTEMLSPPGSPTPTPITTIALTTPANSNSLPSPSPSQVFAPRPIRAPFPVLYRPIPQRLPKHVFQLDESPIARSPSPALTQVVPHRRSSSAASSISSVGDLSARWNAMSMKVVESKTEAEEDKENATTGESSSLIGLYSPSKDVLDELYKIIRNNKSYPFSNFRELSAASPSPLYRTRTPTKTPSSPSHHRKFSGAMTPDSSRSPEREWSKIVFPSSPISRTTMRNPILFNSQFGAATAASE